MNCSQCQERLDEQLDELRPGLRSGALSPADARLQAQQALSETVSNCAECESELRAHLNMRLSLMLPDPEMASVAVPPALRANVRRALERENAAPAYVRSPWKPLKGFAWTGGMLLSAIALFVVARPFLYEAAQKPPASMETGAQAPAPSDGAVMMARKAPPTNQKSSARPTPAKPKDPSTSATAPGNVAQQPSGAVAPPPLPEVASRPQDQDVAPPRSAKSSGRDTNQKPENTQPRGGGGKPSGPVLSAPKNQDSVGAPSTPVRDATAAPESADTVKARPVAPVEPRLDPKLVAPSGEALGLVVRFVPNKSGRDATNGEQRSMMFMARPKPPVTPPDGGGAGPAAIAPPAPISPAPVVPDTRRVQPVPQEDDRDNARVEKMAPNAPAMMRQRVPGAGAPKARTNEAGDANNTGNAEVASPMNAASAPVIEKGSLSIAVKEPVTNARVMGQVQGREGEGIILWSGNAAANKPISVPLEPLKANKGDTINISFQQQVSLGEVKTLATTTVTVP